VTGLADGGEEQIEEEVFEDHEYPVEIPSDRHSRESGNPEVSLK
jgi:hypothetical protein